MIHLITFLGSGQLLFCVTVTASEPWLSEYWWSHIEKVRVPPGAFMVN